MHSQRNSRGKVLHLKNTRVKMTSLNFSSLTTTYLSSTASQLKSSVNPAKNLSSCCESASVGGRFSSCKPVADSRCKETLVQLLELTGDSKPWNRVLLLTRSFDYATLTLIQSIEHPSAKYNKKTLSFSSIFVYSVWWMEMADGGSADSRRGCVWLAHKQIAASGNCMLEILRWKLFR